MGTGGKSGRCVMLTSSSDIYNAWNITSTPFVSWSVSIGTDLPCTVSFLKSVTAQRS